MSDRNFEVEKDEPAVPARRPVLPTARDMEKLTDGSSADSLHTTPVGPVGTSKTRYEALVADLWKGDVVAEPKTRETARNTFRALQKGGRIEPRSSGATPDGGYVALFGWTEPSRQSRLVEVEFKKDSTVDVLIGTGYQRNGRTDKPRDKQHMVLTSQKAEAALLDLIPRETPELLARHDEANVAHTAGKIFSSMRR